MHAYSREQFRNPSNHVESEHTVTTAALPLAVKQPIGTQLLIECAGSIGAGILTLFAHAPA